MSRRTAATAESAFGVQLLQEVREFTEAAEDMRASGRVRGLQKTVDVLTRKVPRLFILSGTEIDAPSDEKLQEPAEKVLESNSVQRRPAVVTR